MSNNNFELRAGYQIHSWDDLDEWHQALRKSHGLSGDKWFKIDPHFMPPGAHHLPVLTL
jgi:hypothetical protein